MPLRLSLAWRNSASRPQHSLLTVVAVGLGVALMLGTVLGARSLQAELDRSARAIAGNADAEVFAFAEPGFSADMVSAIQKLPEVAVSAPLVSKRVFGEAGGTSYTFQLLGLDPVAEQRLHPLSVASGAMVGAADKGQVVVDARWARDHGVHVGDSVSLFTATGPDNFRVKGLLGDSAFLQAGAGPVVVVPLAVAQTSFRLGARVTQVSVGLRRTYPAFRRDLLLRATEEYTVRDNHAYFSTATNPYQDIQPVLVFFSVLALVIGLFLIYNNLAMSVQERRREIGLLRSAGATPGWVRSLFMLQALMLGAAGTVLGLVLGGGVAALLVAYLRGVAGQPSVTLQVDPGLVVGIALLGLAATVACAVLPAAVAARVAPLEAIRPRQVFAVERARVRTTALALVMLLAAGLLIAFGFSLHPLDTGLSGEGLVLVAIGIVGIFGGLVALVPALLGPLTRVLSQPLRLLAPGETLLARNAVVRRPNRSALTIAGLLVSSALVVSIGGLTQGALDAGSRWVDSLFVADQLMVSPVRQPDLVRQDIDKVNGVDATSPIAFFTLVSGSRALNLAAIDPLDYASRGRLQLAPGSPVGAFTDIEESRAILVSRRLAEARGWHPGTRVGLVSASGTLDYRVAAIVEHTLPAPGGEETALVSLANARQDFGVTGFNILQVIPAAGAGDALQARLGDAASRYGMQLEPVSDVRLGVRQGLDSLLLLLTAVGVAGVFLGLLAVVQTILLNIAESTRELALLRAVGATGNQVRGIILAQSGILALSGALVGALAGIGLVAVMTRGAASLGFQPVYEVPWGVVLLVLVASLAGSAAAVLVPARRAASASVVSAIRYE